MEDIVNMNTIKRFKPIQMDHNVVFYEKVIIIQNYFKKWNEILNETMFWVQFETQYIF